MAHELDFQNGRAAMFSVKETPWHKEGIVLNEAPSSVAAALEIAQLNWDVEKRPVFDANGVAIEGYNTVSRKDTGATLGMVSDVYRPVQNLEGFNVLQPLLDKGTAALETGGSLRGGRDVWMMVKFNITDPRVTEVLGDEVIPYGLITNNHAGQRKVIVMETPIRVVCANTHGAAISHLGDTSEEGNFLSLDGKAFGIRHSESAQENLAKAADELFGTLVERYVRIARQTNAMKFRTLTDREFTGVLDKIVGDIEQPRAWKSENHKAQWERAASRRLARRERITTLWTTGDGHAGDHSAWEAYCAVTQSIDHDGDLWGKRKSRISSLYNGELGNIKQIAVDELVALSASEAVA